MSPIWSRERKGKRNGGCLVNSPNIVGNGSFTKDSSHLLGYGKGQGVGRGMIDGRLLKR